MCNRHTGETPVPLPFDNQTPGTQRQTHPLAGRNGAAILPVSHAEKLAAYPRNCVTMTKAMPNHKPRLEDAFLTRRDFLCKCGTGMGALGFASLMAEAGLLSPQARGGEAINPLAAKP